MQPGYDALGFISCTGTNFLVRAKAFQECGWSPHYTLTEDYALGMELKMRHWQVSTFRRFFRSFCCQGRMLRSPERGAYVLGRQCKHR